MSSQADPTQSSADVLLAAADAVKAAVERERIMAIPPADRVADFNATTGVSGYMSRSGPLGGNYHPNRCRCQGDPNPGTTREDIRRGQRGPNGDTTPHKHRAEPPHSCARCSCSAYVPHDWPEGALDGS